MTASAVRGHILGRKPGLAILKDVVGEFESISKDGRSQAGVSFVRAAILESEGHVVLADVAQPTIQAADQVLIQTKAVGICGSEVHAFEGTHPYRKAPVIVGHEASGVVADLGQDVTN